MTGDWDQFHATVREALDAVLAEAPDDMIAEEGKAYVSRIATAALNAAFLDHRLTVHGLAMPLPVQGGPNPDYIMRHAAIDPDRSYRLTGWINGSESVSVGLYAIGEAGAPRLVKATTMAPADCGADGSFSLILSPSMEGAGSLALAANVRLLILRVLHRDDSEPARLALSGSEAHASPTLFGGSTHEALRFASNRLRRNVSQYMPWIDGARGLPNRLDHPPATLADAVIGDARTCYFLGGFDLGDGEWLEIVMPPRLAGYWSLHLYNFWYEHFGTPGVHDRNAVPDADGAIRIAVSGEPIIGVANRIDTRGRRKGALICRITGSKEEIDPPQAQLRRVQR